MARLRQWRSTSRTSPRRSTSASSTACGTRSRVPSTSWGLSSVTRRLATSSGRHVATCTPASGRRCSTRPRSCPGSRPWRPGRIPTRPDASQCRATCVPTTGPLVRCIAHWVSYPPTCRVRGTRSRARWVTPSAPSTSSTRRSSACSTSAPGRTPASRPWSVCSATDVACRCGSRTP